jgi:hypothetical protein
MNSAAMEDCHYADIVAAIPDCPDEWAERDENGEFTGLCSEMVSGIVQDFAQKYTQEERESFQEQYLKWLPSQGITAVTDVTIMPWQEVPKWYHRYKVLENRGELPVRAYIWAGNGPGDDPTDITDAEQIKILSDYFNTTGCVSPGSSPSLTACPIPLPPHLWSPITTSPTPTAPLSRPRPSIWRGRPGSTPSASPSSTTAGATPLCAWRWTPLKSPTP